MDPQPFGLSYPPLEPLQGQPEAADMLRRARMSRVPAGTNPWETMVGSGVPMYPEGTRNSRFSLRPNEPEYKVTNVEPFALAGPDPIGAAPGRFSRSYAPAPVDKFAKVKRGGLGKAEDVDPVSMLSTEADANAPKFDFQMSLMERVKDLLKSTGSGMATGTADLLALPRTAAEIPNRFTGQEIVPDRFIEAMPTAAQYQSMAEKVTGPWYEPKTDAGKYMNVGGQFLPLVAGGTVGGAIKGGMAGGARGAVTGAARGTKVATPLAVMPLYSGW